MTSLPTPEALLDLAEAVIATGFESRRHEVAALVAAARALGVRPVLVDIVADPAAPRPARERALGRLVVLLSAEPARTDRAPAARTTEPAPAA